MAGNSEYINLKILELKNVNYSFCPYFSKNDEPCNNCIKCFRKNLILNKKENLKKYNKNYISNIDKLFSHMTLSAIYSTQKFLKLDSSKNYVQAIGKFYPKALNELCSMEQKSEMLKIYEKIKVKEMDNDDEISLKNIKPFEIEKLLINLKKLLLDKIK